MSGYGVTDIWTYLIGAIGIILLPGPNSVFVLSVATARGVKAGIQGACGVFVGDTVLLGLTALGAAGLLHTFPALFLVVKYVGAAYLCWIGLSLLWAAIHNWRQPPVDLAHPPETPANLAHPFRRAFVISLLNPKAILFLLSFFVQFIDPGYHTPAVPFLILSSILMLLSALYLFSLIYAGAALAQGFRQRKRLTSSLSGAVGGLFVWFGAKLATASLN